MFWLLTIALVSPQEMFQIVRQSRFKRPDNRHIPIREGTKGYGCCFHTSDNSGMWILPRHTKKVDHKKLTSLYSVPYTTQEMIHIKQAKLQKFDSIFFKWNFITKRLKSSFSTKAIVPIFPFIAFIDATRVTLRTISSVRPDADVLK